MRFLPTALKARLAHSSEVLASEQTRSFFESLRHSYDYIIVDFAPLMPIVDVRASTNLVDGFVYVVEWGKTRTDFVEQALHSAKGVYEHLLGVVLNKVDLGAVGRYDGHGGTTTLMRTIIDMAIPTEVRSVRIAAAYFLTRTFICLLGLGAVVWGGFALPLFWQQAPVNGVASAILRGHTFKMQWLSDEARQAEAAEQSAFCNPTALHNAVVLRLDALDEAIAAN